MSKEDWEKAPKIKKICVGNVLIYGGKDRCKVAKKISIQTDCNAIVKVCYEIAFDDGLIEYWNTKGIKSFFRFEPKLS